MRFHSKYHNKNQDEEEQTKLICKYKIWKLFIHRIFHNTLILSSLEGESELSPSCVLAIQKITFKRFKNL